jgi:hypothetical protein
MTLRVMVNGTQRTFEEPVKDWADDDKDALRTASLAYHRGDLFRMIDLVDTWAVEFDDDDEGAAPPVVYASFAAVLAAAAAARGKVALPLTGFVDMGNPDPDRVAIGQRHAAWWQAQIQRCTTSHRANEVVIGGHGYRKPWETDTFVVPAGTTLTFYVPDDKGLVESIAVELADAGSGSEQVRNHLLGIDAEIAVNALAEQDPAQRALKYKRVYQAGEEVYNYTVTPPEPTDQPMSVCVTVSTRVKLADLILPNLGNVHVALCRLIDWYAGSKAQPGAEIHAMPHGWRFVRRHMFEGYEGPAGEQPPAVQAAF